MIGRLPVDQIDTTLVLKCLEPIWTTKTETASRLRGRIESVLNWATARNYRSGDNPARWRGHLDKLLPRPSQVARTKHHAAMPYTEVGAFMQELHAAQGIATLALEFTILTAARTNEVIKADWSEFDLRRKLWSIPEDRMKSKRPHRVPLSDRVLEILHVVRGKDETYVFPSHRASTPLSNAAMMKVLRRLGHNDTTVHGFRSSFRDWCAESTRYPGEVAEMALAHVLRDKTEAAYRRGDLLEKRARLMQDWARYCSRPSEPADVIDIRRMSG